MYKLTSGIIAVLFLTGCADIRLQKTLAESATLPEGNCRALPGYYEKFSRMDKEVRQQEMILSTEAWHFDPEGCNQLRLAMILSHPDNPDEDRIKALMLLNDLLDEKDNIHVVERQMASLLKGQLDQLLFIQQQTNALKEELRTERIVSAIRLKRLTDLESQLEQLKNIEENINEMEKAIVTPATTDSGPHESTQNPAGR